MPRPARGLGRIRRRRAALILAAASIATASSRAAARAEPLFSEYVEGAGYDKALEVWNPDDAAVDLAARGLRVEVYFDGASTPGRTIPLAGVIAPGGVFVLAHGSSDAILRDLADQHVAGAFFAGDDAVVLRDATGAVLDVIGQVGVDPGAAWGSASLGTLDRTLRRAPGTVADRDVADAFVPARDWVAASAADFGDLGAPPGWLPPPPAPGAVRIHDVQGRGHLSPLVGRVVDFVPGIVTAVLPGGFTIQNPWPDGDAATSEGLFVYRGALPAPEVGASVLVSGRVAEYRPGARDRSLTVTELRAHAIEVVPALDGGRGIAPEVLGSEGRPFPWRVVDDDTRGSLEVPEQTFFDPDHDGVDFYESLESMWVVVPDARVVAPTNAFGEVWVVADGGRAATGLNAAGGLTRLPDDAPTEAIAVSDVAFPGTMPALDVGAGVGTLDGIVAYAFERYELRVLERPTSDGSSPPLDATTLVGDAEHVTIATLNVQNLDPKLEDRALVVSARDVDDDVGDGRFARLAAQIVEALAAPDVIALQEVQDSDGAERSGRTDASATYARLTRAIAEAGGPDYAFADVAPNDGEDGGQPGGNIRVGFLHRKDRVALRAAPGGPGGSDDRVAIDPGAAGPVLSHNPGRLPLASPEDAPLFVGARKPIVAQFDPIGSNGRVRRDRSFFVVNAHFPSRVGSAPSFGPVQPPAVRGEAARRAQAHAIAGFARRLGELAPGARLVVAGDLNAPAYEPPLAILTGAGLVEPALSRLSSEERYTAIFEGASQDLDHILVAGAHANRLEVEIVHVNAEYADRVTDHDPIVARLRLAPRRPRGVSVGLFDTLLDRLRALFARFLR